MIIKHNLSAINAGRHNNFISKAKAKSTEKLSSGYRINRAADDAAGLSISEKMRRQIRGLNQGTYNTQDGISLCQVADGALVEVQEMVQRINELSVKAANGTWNNKDRGYIEQEVDQLLKEIDSIMENTNFNGLSIFQGKNWVPLTSGGVPDILGNIPFSDFQLANSDYGSAPFNPSSPSYNLGLTVDTVSGSVFGKKSWSMMDKNGSSSQTSFRLHYSIGSGDVHNEVSLDSLVYIDGSYQFNSSTNTWSRSFSYTNSDGVDLVVKQIVAKKGNAGQGEQSYAISYSLQNVGSVNVKADFMFNAKTSYSKNANEGYYISGNRVTNSKIYTNSGDASNPNHNKGIPSDFTIIDPQNALQFAQSVKINSSNKPDMVSFGNNSEIMDWDYYDHLDTNLGKQSTDVGFSMIWSNDTLNVGSSVNYSFDYGIRKTSSDHNLTGVDIHYDDRITVNHEPVNHVWIQSGADQEDGISLDLEELNTEIMGISNLSCRTEIHAGNAIKSTKNALESVSRYRSKMGAYQNRLEHTYNNNKNIVENTQEAESRIRDTDMAREMMKYANDKILSQAGTSILSQANQSRNGVISLLQ